MSQVSVIAMKSGSRPIRRDSSDSSLLSILRAFTFAKAICFVLWDDGGVGLVLCHVRFFGLYSHLSRDTS